MAFYATDIGEQASPKTKPNAEAELKQIPSLIHIRKRMWHRAVMRMFRQNIHTMCASVFRINVFNTMNLIVIVKRVCIRITCDVFNVSDRQRICSIFSLQLTLCSLYFAFFLRKEMCHFVANFEWYFDKWFHFSRTMEVSKSFGGWWM